MGRAREATVRGIVTQYKAIASEEEGKQTSSPHLKHWIRSFSRTGMNGWKPFLFFPFFLTCIYFWETETEREEGRGRERGGHRIQSRLQALSCQHRAWLGAQTHELWDHDLSWSWRPYQLSHPGAPESSFRLSHQQHQNGGFSHSCWEALVILQSAQNSGKKTP